MAGTPYPRHWPSRSTFELHPQARGAARRPWRQDDLEVATRRQVQAKRLFGATGVLNLELKLDGVAVLRRVEREPATEGLRRRRVRAPAKCGVARCLHGACPDARGGHVALVQVFALKGALGALVGRRARWRPRPRRLRRRTAPLPIPVAGDAQAHAVHGLAAHLVVQRGLDPRARRRRRVRALRRVDAPVRDVVVPAAAAAGDLQAHGVVAIPLVHVARHGW
mmetsp:Transcript_31183/g.99051  ORF Transcript_31183/g.99051 Transcript_31183/m.99051 type:complete len:223 (-) Transcript_31183:135-803(-)